MSNLEVAIGGVKIVAKILNVPAPELYIKKKKILKTKK